MLIKRIAIASAAVLGLLPFGHTASAGPIIPGQAAYFSEAASMAARNLSNVADDWDYPRRHRRRFARHRDWREGYYGYGHRRESGPPYSSCFMKCIYSSHPADFCSNVARDHFCY